MKSKFATLIIAIILGLIATGSTALYIKKINQSALAGEQLKKIYIAKKAIPKGEKLIDLISRKEIKLEAIPSRYAAENTLSSKDEFDGLVLTSDLSKGEQITSSIVDKPSQAELAFQIPKDKIAISIPVDEVVGVSGNLKKGDRVNVIATFSPGEGGKDITRTLLRNILVLSSSEEVAIKNQIKSSPQKGSKSNNTVNLAVSQVESEKLIFAEEKGHVWLALLPVGYKDNGINTVGRTVDSVFK